MSYYKIFALSAISSFLFLSVFVIVAFDSDNALSEAYEHYAHENYTAARTFLLNEDITIPLADFYLYESYLAREELGVKKSQNYLMQAQNEIKVKKTTTALEITLNLAFNAFLLNDATHLKSLIEESKLLASKEEVEWVNFFEGCHAYLCRDYEMAYFSWKNSLSKKWLSSWMKTSFSKNPDFKNIDYKFMHSVIATNHFNESRNYLKNLLMSDQNKDVYHTLTAFSYFQEANQIPPSMRALFYKNGVFEINEIENETFLLKQEKNHIFALISAHIFDEIKHENSEDTDFFVSFLENYQAYEEIRVLAKKINNEVFTSRDSDKMSILVKNLPEGLLKQAVTEGITKNICRFIADNQLDKVALVLLSCKETLVQNNTSKKLLLNAIDSYVFNSFDYSFDNCTKAIDLWNQLETNPYSQYLFSKQLIKKAYLIWSLDKKESTSAVALMNLAKKNSLFEYEEDLKYHVENSVKKIYNQFVYIDDVQGLSQVFVAIDKLNLSIESIIPSDEAFNQLEDAYYYLKIRNFDMAMAKTAFALKLMPNLSAAHKIAALIHYENDAFEKTLKHITFLNETDESLSEILAMKHYLLGNTERGDLFFKKVSNPLIFKIKLIANFLSQSRADEALFWLQQIDPDKTDVNMAFMIASFQKNDHPNVLKYYSFLEESEKSIPAIVAMLIQTYVSMNEMNKAEYLFVKFSLSLQSPTNLANYTKDNHSLQKILKDFNPYNFAGRYYLHIRNDNVSADKMFGFQSNY